MESEAIKDICVLISAYNEEKTIGFIVSELKKKFNTVIVVDDGSTDGTYQLARTGGAVVLQHEVCRGKGAALRTGFEYVQKLKVKAVITMDGDGQHLVKDTKLFVSAYRKKRPDVGIFVGKRMFLAKDMPFLRKLTNMCMSMLISGLSGQFIPDTQSGFRLITVEVLQKMNLFTSHFETESEILIRAAWKGFRISAVPIATVYESEKSKIRPTADTARFFLMLACLFFPFLRRLRNGL